VALQYGNRPGNNVWVPDAHEMIQTSGYQNIERFAVIKALRSLREQTQPNIRVSPYMPNDEIIFPWACTTVNVECGA